MDTNGQKMDVMSLFPEELETLCKKMGQPSYRAKQMFTFLSRGVPIEEMTTLPKDFRQALAEACEYRLPEIEEKQVSALDGTIKYLFRLLDGECIESVFMRYEHGNTLCISSEVGCPMGCVFCASTLGGKVRVETLGATAEWLRRQYRRTPPVSIQASRDWSGNGLTAQWYASVNYRVGLLTEDGHLRIRDLFLFREDYPCRYLHKPIHTRVSTFDALPLLWPQVWGGAADRPYIRLLDEDGAELTGAAVYDAPDGETARARLMAGENCIAELTMDPTGMTISGDCRLRFDRLPVLKEIRGREFLLEHDGFGYSFTLERGTAEGLTIRPEEGVIRLRFGADHGPCRWEEEVPIPAHRRSESRPVPPMAPVAEPADSVIPWGEAWNITLTSRDPGTIRYTLDGTEPDENAEIYDGPIRLEDDAVLTARLFCADCSVSEMGQWTYRFGRKDLGLTSPTELDYRDVFRGNGLTDLLRTDRGTTDYLDGRWRGTLEDVDITAELEPERIESISMGFLTHHRSGIVYPKTVELYTGPDREHLELKEVLTMPDGPGEREIQRMDAVFRVEEPIGAFRILARRHERMPQWCIYRGTTRVFTMTDCLIVRPEKDVK